MIEPGSPRAALIGRWGTAVAMVISAVLLGRIIRDMPYLLPNRLAGLVLYELGPALLLSLAIAAATRITTDSSVPFSIRLLGFTTAAFAAGMIVLASPSMTEPGGIRHEEQGDAGVLR